MSDMTIRELAEKLDVSKTTINNLISSCGLNGKLRKTGTSFLLTKQQVAIIEKQIAKTDDHKHQTEKEIEKDLDATLRSKSSQTQFAIENIPATHLQSQNSQAQLSIKDSQIAALQSQISELIQSSQKQLCAKDNQIAALQSQMSELTESLQQTTSALNAAQALHAKTMQQKLLLESEIENKKSIKKWWMFWKNKKNTCECSR